MDHKQHSLFSHLTPMLIMYGISAALAALKQFIMTDHMAGHEHHAALWYHAWMNDFMGIMFIISAVLKLIGLKKFANMYAQYDLIAQHLYLYGMLYPFIELGLGAAYLARWNLMLTNWAVLILMLINAAGIVIALITKKQVSCVSMGAAMKMPMNYAALVDPLLMAAMALMMLY